ncbi:short-chain dehydrogenase [Periconia macrospinosa]|uniref:Short-chain dehydrogenase n=1 Tax=Periconia macrospinosa TaxID=97972 RepID=A0A2V1DF06_9PLEO|nr:short-chain dehydrogenase [Periconia macrospinosa]
MGAQFSQFFPPRPSFTEADFESQSGNVFIVTGGSSGIGYELVKKLYQKGGNVYIAGRSEDKARAAIREIESAVSTGGKLNFLFLELDDLSSIKASVEEFKKKEKKLNVLWHNAGVSQPPLGSVSKQGYELQLATNCLGPFLLTKLLLPLLERVVWTSSQIVELSAPKGGLVMSELSTPPRDRTRNYINSKTGNLLLAAELARRFGQSHGIISVAVNPGAANTDLFRHTPWMPYVAWPLLYTAEKASNSQFYAGLSSDITAENNGCYIIPWGRISQSMRKDLVDATKQIGDGGTGRAEGFWEFCEEHTKAYV